MSESLIFNFSISTTQGACFDRRSTEIYSETPVSPIILINCLELNYATQLQCSLANNLLNDYLPGLCHMEVTPDHHLKNTAALRYLVDGGTARIECQEMWYLDNQGTKDTMVDCSKGSLVLPKCRSKSLFLTL